MYVQGSSLANCHLLGIHRNSALNLLLDFTVLDKWTLHLTFKYTTHSVCYLNIMVLKASVIRENDVHIFTHDLIKALGQTTALSPILRAGACFLMARLTYRWPLSLLSSTLAFNYVSSVRVRFRVIFAPYVSTFHALQLIIHNETHRKRLKIRDSSFFRQKHVN